MLNHRFSIARILLGSVASLIFAAAPALAAPHGHSAPTHSRAPAARYHAGTYHSNHYGAYRYHGGPHYYNGYRSGFYGLGAYPYYYGNNYYPYDYTYYNAPTYYVTPPATNVIVTPDASVSEPEYYGQAAMEDSAHIDVLPPTPDAEILFDGTVTQQRGIDRQFVSPPLTPGRPYSYVIEARWMQNGHMMDESRTVTVTAGQSATVDFTR